MRDGKTRIVNDLRDHPDSVKVPEGHVPVRCFLGVPLKDGGRTIGIIGLANKEGGYTESNVNDIESLSVVFVEALKSKRTEIEIKNLNKNLKLQTVQLEVANKELESFSYSVSHDLRAPLRSIDGFSKILLEDHSERVDEEGKHCLRRVCAASVSMSQLIDDMLKLSRVTRSEMCPQKVNLSKIAHVISKELKRTDSKRKADFIIATDVVVDGDRQLLQLVLENLLGNAWKFTSSHPQARIEFGTQKYNNSPVYFVRDDGVGFDMAYVDKLFVPFQRLHGSSEFQGTGIGLATAQRIIKRHGGRIWAKSVPKKGATFYFTL